MENALNCRDNAHKRYMKLEGILPNKNLKNYRHLNKFQSSSEAQTIIYLQMRDRLLIKLYNMTSETKSVRETSRV